jgi:hypothetical protein
VGALFAVYQAICRIIGIAVNAAGIPPARISFPHALAAATDTVAAFPLTRHSRPTPSIFSAPLDTDTDGI